ncbi:MAG: hypothetical protein LBR33_10085, partial [Propionibacteriaceae bacterium]|nr:hypothetical protein [Propionibacteriaceae bacterium]
EAITAVGITPPTTLPTPLHLATVRVATGLKMPDAVVVATAQALSSTVATFDQDLAKKAASVGVATLDLMARPAAAPPPLPQEPGPV